MNKKIKTKSKESKNLYDVHVVFVNIFCTFNNILLSITTQNNGNVLFHTSSGANGFKGPKKSTPYAAQIIAEKAREWLYSNKIKALAIKLYGPQNTRDSAIKVLSSTDGRANSYVVTSISDVTTLPHNGCRPRKIRKV